MQGSDGFNWRTPEEVRGYLRSRPALTLPAAADGADAEAAAAEAAADMEEQTEAPPQERNSHAAAFLEGDLLVISGECNGDLCKESCVVDTSNKVGMLSSDRCTHGAWSVRTGNLHQCP